MLDWIIKYWLELLMTSCVALLAGSTRLVWTRIKREHEEQESIKQGVLALLRNGLINNYNQYIERDFIPIYAMESIQGMYNAYHELGGNGTITKLVDELKAMPSSPAAVGK